MTRKKKDRFDPASIQKIRARLNVTQAEFADKIGVSQPTVAMWESGIRKPGGPAKKLLNMLAEKKSEK